MALRAVPGRLGRYAWAAPCTAAGLVAGLLVLLAGGSVRATHGVLEFALRPEPWRPRLPFHAITLGHVIVGTTPAVLARLRAHELVHVRQYERWGVVFFLAYPAASLWLWLGGRRPYRDNPFEVEARRRSGEESAPPRR